MLERLGEGGLGGEEVRLVEDVGFGVIGLEEVLEGLLFVRMVLVERRGDEGVEEGRGDWLVVVVSRMENLLEVEIELDFGEGLWVVDGCLCCLGVVECMLVWCGEWCGCCVFLRVVGVCVFCGVVVGIPTVVGWFGGTGSLQFRRLYRRTENISLPFPSFPTPQ